MLNISEEQLAVLRVAQLNRFNDKVYTEIKRRLSDELQNITDHNLKDRVQYAIDTASKYGFTTEKDVTRYAFLVAILDKGFQEDSCYSWVISILESKEFPTARLDQLSHIILMENR